MICDSCHSILGNGSGNTINGAMYSTIVNGLNNSVNGQHNVVLGGTNNAIGAAYNHAAVFGAGLNAVASDTFHVSCVNAVNTPGPFTAPPALPAGTIYHGVAGAPLIAGACVLYIR